MLFPLLYKSPGFSLLRKGNSNCKSSMDLNLGLSALFLLFLLATNPCSIRGNSDVSGSEVYEIDYKGPETHPSVSPPEGSHGRPYMHQQTNVISSKQFKSQSSKAGKQEQRLPKFSVNSDEKNTGKV